MGYNFNPFTGNLDDVGTGGAASVGGSDTQVQFNDAGAFGGDADLTWNKTTNVLGITGDVNLSDGGTYTTTLQTITPTAARTISFPDSTGTVALVGGSSSQLLWNNAGALAGASTLTYDGSILTTSGRFINSYNATASGPAKSFVGTWFTGGTSTTTKPQVLIEPTGATSTAWSTSGTALGVNAASGFAGNLLDLQVNGTSKASLTATGNFTVAGLAVSTGYRTNLSGGNGFEGYWGASFKIFDIYSTNGSVNLRLDSGGIISWNNGLLGVTTPDLFIARDAANTLAQRNDTNAQTFRLYNTYTSATNYERGKLEWSSNVFRIGTEKGSGGGTAQAVEVHTDSISRLALDTTGSVRIVTGLTVATLPSSPTVGMIARVTNALAPAVGATVAGGGAAAALCWYNGASWSVIGV
jgi:hypothetical protein